MVQRKLRLFLLLPILWGAGLWHPALLAADSAISNYKELCVKCHGVTGKGNGPDAKTLNPRPADYTDCAKMTKDSDETLFKIIKGGSQSVGRSKEMPPWAEALSDQEIHDLVAYVRSFCKK
jgi:cytochrome c oxidase cbb3-type subunit III